MQNDLLIRALQRQPVERTPIWVMRQAGRYLPEYRKVRAQAGDFMTLCQTPELACEVTLQPIDRFDLDAAILFSDILTVPDAMGCELAFKTGEGPVFNHPVTCAEDIAQLPTEGVTERLTYVFDAVRTIKKALADRVPLIGFAGSPWTVATYMVEGRSSKQFTKIKKLMYQAPESLHALLDKLAINTAAYLTAQIEAGVDVVMLFDTWGGVLSTQNYHAFSLHYMKKVFAHIPRDYAGKVIPRIAFTKGGNQWLELMADMECDALGLDWKSSLKDARERVGDKVALQGNLDPGVLYADPETIADHVRKTLVEYGDYPGHIFNLGHGIFPDIPPEHVQALVAAVREGV